MNRASGGWAAGGSRRRRRRRRSELTQRAQIATSAIWAGIPGARAKLAEPGNDLSCCCESRRTSGWRLCVQWVPSTACSRSWRFRGSVSSTPIVRQQPTSAEPATILPCSPCSGSIAPLHGSRPPSGRRQIDQNATRSADDPNHLAAAAAACTPRMSPDACAPPSTSSCATCMRRWKAAGSWGRQFKCGRVVCVQGGNKHKRRVNSGAVCNGSNGTRTATNSRGDGGWRVRRGGYGQGGR